MGKFPTDIMRIAMCGDWHGNYSYAQKALLHCIREGADVIIHVGDFGFWALNGYLDMLNDLCEQHGVILMFVDGNHEHHVLLNSIPVDDDGVRRIKDRLWHLPRGFRWEWEGVTFMALGGAHSVDADDRRVGIDYFTEETITLGEAYRAAADGPVDVLITHDCPDGVDIPGMTKDSNFFPAHQIEKAQRHRALLREVVNEVTPRFLWHGHYHRRYQAWLQIDDEHKCLVTGLDKDGTAFDKNVHIVDVYQLAEWWVDDEVNVLD